nr:MAG TPA: hypothetical protein [Caudoviricetes sp.]
MTATLFARRLFRAASRLLAKNFKFPSFGVSWVNTFLDITYGSYF